MIKSFKFSSAPTYLALGHRHQEGQNSHFHRLGQQLGADHRGRGGDGEVEGGKGRVNGVGRRLDLGW